MAHLWARSRPRGESLLVLIPPLRPETRAHLLSAGFSRIWSSRIYRSGCVTQSREMREGKEEKGGAAGKRPYSSCSLSPRQQYFKPNVLSAAPAPGLLLQMIIFCAVQKPREDRGRGVTRGPLKHLLVYTSPSFHCAHTLLPFHDDDGIGIVIFVSRANKPLIM